jgi:hypothetical protein
MSGADDTTASVKSVDLDALRVSSSTRWISVRTVQRNVKPRVVVTDASVWPQGKRVTP